jgi:tripartite-type tricarboxylate transporter receptor subunit TctC
MKRLTILLAAIAACNLFTTSAFAADVKFPTKPVQMIVPYPAGQGIDVIARIVADELGKKWGQAVYVDNRAGGASIPGMVAGRDARPDGHTLTMTSVGALAINPAVFPKLAYDPLKDYVMVNAVYSVPLLILATPGSNIKTLKELVDEAKKKPGSLNMGIAGTATIQHVAAEAWKGGAAIDMPLVLYKGSAPMINDMLGGHIPLGIDSVPAVLSHIKADKMRALAITTKARAPQLPDVPTVAESGFPGFEAVGWVGIIAPRETPREITAKISADVREILASADVRKKIVDTGAVVDARDSKEFSEFVAREVAAMRDTVAKAGIKVE